MTIPTRNKTKAKDSAGWFDSHAMSHTGRVRPVNEDRFLSKPLNGVWLVADGMGGHSHGDVAASMIVQAAGRVGHHAVHEAKVQDFHDHIFSVNQDIRNLAREHGLGVMGSTLVALLVTGQHFSVVWSGDSRLYLNRGNRMTQISKDHTEVQQMIDDGTLDPAAAASFKRKNVILHAIGVHELPHLDLLSGELKDGDTFILCSDGLTAHLSALEIQDIILSQEPETACNSLINSALERGGSDNVTVVVVNYRVAPAHDGRP
ncbi:protein phosphatase 2C domain-containing protein [Phyllobacterium sp. OV277]|uniref:PP2C family protein-serine/threonine phosphatase n=1 Tax=Phyllobacterium sp. OV277 TaxID=1882772 RepID=UPI00088058BC|nr:protein phosphatase 2C domain-containing protein [Phyllobacterium sp. OV277]SDP90054.1 protein phosphatase [Phyllobacterium sp. OV277]